MNSILRTVHLTKRFDGVAALEDLNLEIRQGEILGLLGPNGAGKTTTVNLILGLLSPTAGRVELFGEDLSDDAEAAELVAVSQREVGLDGLELKRPSLEDLFLILARSGWK